MLMAQSFKKSVPQNKDESEAIVSGIEGAEK